MRFQEDTILHDHPSGYALNQAENSNIFSTTYIFAFSQRLHVAKEREGRASDRD
jgi:hypothetical protein